MDIFGVDAAELGGLEEGDSGEEGEGGDDEDEEDDEYYSGEEEEAEEEEELDEDGNVIATTRKRQQKRGRTRAAQHKLEDIFEPEELEKNLMTERDQQIRVEDIPERFLLRSTVPVTSEPDENELEKEAEWIYTQAFQSNLCISKQVI
jgi:hypothetical protein